MAAYDAATGGGSARASWLYDPRIRGIAYQLLAGFGVIAFLLWVGANTVENLQRQNIASGFGFLNGRAGFDVSQSLIAYTNDSTYGRALVVGIINTILVAALGIVTATIIGFIVGLARLSRNWLVRKIATAYVEIFRNIPPLLVIFFWYFGVLSVLPNPRNSLDLPLGAFINNRGIVIPKPVWSEGAWLVGVALLVALAIAWFVRRWAAARQAATGQRFPVWWTSLGLLIGMPLLALVVQGFPVSFEVPELGTFNLRGGLQVAPEFLALFLALSFYTAAFIAEIVRAGIMGVARGQTEAAHALGLRPGPTTRLVIVPQAMRIIIPPLTSQYLNLTKNSSLAIAIGYADLVAIGGTILNQTGQAIEVVAIWMVVYLGLSLATSAFMNWFNARMALVER